MKKNEEKKEKLKKNENEMKIRRNVLLYNSYLFPRV